MKDDIIIVGDCPICEREMWEGKSIDKHHFTPKCKGGTETKYIHRICHSKIHSLFSESELADYYNTPARLLENEEMIKFVKWVSKKEPDYYDISVRASRKGRRR